LYIIPDIVCKRFLHGVILRDSVPYMAVKRRVLPGWFCCGMLDGRIAKNFVTKKVVTKIFAAM
jgi:hypothetical protein